MRYRLRTLLILLALMPPLGAWVYLKVEQYQRKARAKAELRQRIASLQIYSDDVFIFLQLGTGAASSPIQAQAERTNTSNPSDETTAELNP